MPSSTGNKESKMKPSLPSLHVRLPSTDSGIQADAGFDSLSRYKGKHFLSSSGHKSETSNAQTSSSATSDVSDVSQSISHSPCTSSGYNSEARGSTPPSLPARMPRELTPPTSSTSSSLTASTTSFHSDESPSPAPSSMTSSWAGGTSFSKSKPQAPDIQLPTRISAPAGNASTATATAGKSKSSIHIPPKPKVPPPKRPAVNANARPVLSPARPLSGHGVKMVTSQDGGIQVSISRTHPTAVQPSTHNASRAGYAGGQQNSGVSNSQAKTTIDVRPSPGSTVKVKVVSGSGGTKPQLQPRPQALPRSSASAAPRQGQGCIPLTRPLRVGALPSTALKRAIGTPKVGAMSQPPPPPPHSEQLQQLHQRHQQVAAPQTGAKPRPLTPKPQVSPRKTFLSNANHPVATNSHPSEGDDISSRPTHNHPPSGANTLPTTTTTATSTSIATTSIITAATSSTSSKSSGSVSQNTTTSCSAPSSTARSINIPVSSQCSNNTSPKENTTSTSHQIKSNYNHHSVYNSCSTTSVTSTPSSISTPKTTANNKNSVDSCTFTYKSPEKSFFTQTFYAKDGPSGKYTPTFEGGLSKSSPGVASPTGRLGTSDRRHLGFIRDDLKAGDKQSRMRHAELLQKRSDELFQDAWSFLNASDDEIDRCFFGDDFFSSHSPSPDRTNVRERIKVTPDVTGTADKHRTVKSDVNLNSKEAGPALVSENKLPLSQLGGDKGESVPWKIRKERIDNALSWLKQELASLRDMDKNIVNQFRRCQDTIETLKNQREIWEGLSEEGEEAEYWDDLEINEFNRNYLNSPGGSSLSPMSTGSRDLGFQEVSTSVSLPFPEQPSTNGTCVSPCRSVTQDVEASL